MYSAPENDDKFIQIIRIIKLPRQKSRQKWENPRWNSYVGHWNSNVGIPMSNIGIPTLVFQVQPRNSEAREPTIMIFTKKQEKQIIYVILHFKII